MTKKVELTALYVMVIAHIIYDWAIPFVPNDFHALFASSWNLTLFGYISLRLVDDSLKSISNESANKLTIGAYFIYRAFINGVSFLQSFELDGSWDRYKTVTSNYYADAFVWTVIAIILMRINWKQIKGLCRKVKTT